MTSVSSVAAKESPAQESWITFGRSTHSSSLLKPAISFLLRGTNAVSRAPRLFIGNEQTPLDVFVLTLARRKRALRCGSPLPVCREDPTTCFDIRWARRGEDSRFIRKDVFFPQLNSTRAVRRMARFPCGMSGVYMWWTGRCGMEKKNSTDPPTDIISVIISSGTYMLKISTPLQLF